MRQVFIGWGVAVKRKGRKIAVFCLTIYFPHPLLHVRTSHNVEGLLFIVTLLFNIMEVSLLCLKKMQNQTGTQKHWCS